MQNLTAVSYPDVQELRDKKEELGRLQQELAERELEFSTRRNELHLFEKHYHQAVGKKYAELDELKARVLEFASGFFPKTGPRWEQAEAAREQAERSKKEAREHADEGEGTGETGKTLTFNPPDDLKKLFREVAKKIHPDLAESEAESRRRHTLMARLNKAYAEMDAEAVQAVSREWEDEADEKSDLPLGAQLARIIEKISRVRKRLESLQTQIDDVVHSEMFGLKEGVEKAEREGRDVLREMCDEIDEKSQTIKSRLRALASDCSPQGQ